MDACRNSIFCVSVLFLARFSFQSSFFSESRLCTQPLFSHFVTNLERLADQPIQIFFAVQIFFLFQIFYVFLHRVNPVGDNCMMTKASVALAPVPSSHCCTHRHLCHRIMIVTTRPHLRRNPFRRRKRQKKSIFIYGATN